MNRILATALLAAVAFTGCMNDNSEEYKRYQQILPGMNIYNSTTIQQNVSMQMASAGLRLASLLAEAKKQNPDTDLAQIDLSTIEIEVWSADRSLQLLLFGPGATVTRESETTWRITYPEGGQQASGYYLEGSLVVNTNGSELLSEATFSNPWQVVIQPDFGIKVNSSDNWGGTTQVAIDMNSGITKLYLDETGNYVVILDGVQANFADSETFVSFWSGQLNLKPESGESLAFSDIWDDELHVESSNVPMAPYGAGFWGSTFYANMSGTGSMGMSYKLQDGVYRFTSRIASGSVGVYAQIVEGTQTCSYTSVGDYDTSLFPSGDVEYRWSYENDQLSYTVIYNGYTYTF